MRIGRKKDWASGKRRRKGGDELCRKKRGPVLGGKKTEDREVRGVFGTLSF
jgi:hypothetical protein